MEWQASALCITCVMKCPPGGTLGAADAELLLPPLLACFNVRDKQEQQHCCTKVVCPAVRPQLTELASCRHQALDSNGG